jgi:transposase
MDTILMGRRAGSRNYPQSYKRRVVHETFENGRSVAAVARDHGLNANMVFCWRRDPRFCPEKRSLTKGVTFLPVEVASTEPEAPPMGAEERHGEIELVLRPGHRLLLRGKFDADSVLQLVQGLSRL